MSTLVHSAQLVDAGQLHDDAWVLFDGGRVAGRGAGPEMPAADEKIDATGRMLTPGLVDIHCHGAGGASYDAGGDDIATARAVHREHGTTSSLISLVTASVDDMARRVAAIADLSAADATILGSHLEGPFLDPGHKGAHTAELLCTPDAASVEKLIEAGRGTLRQVTIAPELPGAIEAIERFVAAGVTVAIGHTDADHDTAQRAFDAGASVVTHAFNAMRGIHHRSPGPVVAALRDERVTLELVADGVHVDLGLIAVVFAAAGARVALVTDAMAAAGAGDGCYDLGGLQVTVTDGVARLQAGGAIAGSTLTQDAALRRTVAAGVPLEVALHSLTAVPARAVGASDVGSLEVGCRADAVLWDANLRVTRVWSGGVETLGAAG
ncbi:N-acetylglucosamine-6-phosphate deacetylase [Microbacterium sp. C7(2022)]|uniref:N-acetylglucosamine-6-phosphate deacetylase n=1 Tax=Microbacterium sp. C7(2022) TaxID=2992759 RepID=UPI00237B537C|nr:N-acetylglucosamine-6-phosphate deacetylase [Microbacterium sp. C7(2022)]MDE0547510.1 N-acetylglucosamine-6-phosphate deacetylase [Microbacterium sp. C7(2022)]